MKKFNSGFTLLELVFAIVVIGILSAIAIPKLAASRDDAKIAKARTTLAAVRSALGAEKQKRILRGNFDQITSLGDSTHPFNTFSDTGHEVLTYPEKACAGSEKGCWKQSSSDTYVYVLPTSGEVTFKLENNRLVCKSGSTCDKLE